MESLFPLSSDLVSETQSPFAPSKNPLEVFNL